VAEGSAARLRGEHATAERARRVAAPNVPRREGGDMTGESTAAHTAPGDEDGCSLDWPGTPCASCS
jgi:hypothetical protein